MTGAKVDRRPNKPVEAWLCPECREVHDDEDDAAYCCAGSTVITVLGEPVEPVRCWRCFREYLAADSAEDEDELEGEVINAAAVEVAGHCRNCKPQFSYDEQDAIEKLALEKYQLKVGLYA